MRGVTPLELRPTAWDLHLRTPVVQESAQIVVVCVKLLFYKPADPVPHSFASSARRMRGLVFNVCTPDC